MPGTRNDMSPSRVRRTFATWPFPDAAGVIAFLGLGLQVGLAPLESAAAVVAFAAPRFSGSVFVDRRAGAGVGANVAFSCANETHVRSFRQVPRIRRRQELEVALGRLAPDLLVDPETAAVAP